MDLHTVADVVRPRCRSDLAGVADGDAFLAGGTWLFSEPQPSLRRLVDLTTLGWTAMCCDAGGIEIAATCRIAELFAKAPALAWPAARLIQPCCEALLGSFKIWNAATVGGNICLALPAGPMTALAAALDATCVIWTPDGGARELPAVDVVLGDRRTALRRGEVLRAITLPAAQLRRRAAFRQIALSPVGRSAALLIGTMGEDGVFALTITASTPRPIRLAFAAPPPADALAAAIETEVSARGLWFDDMHGAPDWRRHVSLCFAEEIRCELTGGG